MFLLSAERATDRTPTSFSRGRRILIKAGLGLVIPLLVEPSKVFAQQACPPLPTDGNPAECFETDFDLNTELKVSRFYYVDKNGNGQYDHEDEDIMGVPGARILIERLKVARTSDFFQTGFRKDNYSRRIHNGVVYYDDTKNKLTRQVELTTLLSIPAEGPNRGGIGLGIDSQGRDRIVWHKSRGEEIDKVWTRNTICSPTEYQMCGWNCVQFVVISRLDAFADLSKYPLDQLPNEYIHRYNDKISSIAAPVYFWQGAPQTDHFYLNSAVIPGSDLWNKEKLERKYVERPPYIFPLAA